MDKTFLEENKEIINTNDCIYMANLLLRDDTDKGASLISSISGVD